MGSLLKNIPLLKILHLSNILFQLISHIFSILHSKTYFQGIIGCIFFLINKFQLRRSYNLFRKAYIPHSILCNHPFQSMFENIIFFHCPNNKALHIVSIHLVLNNVYNFKGIFCMSFQHWYNLKNDLHPKMHQNKCLSKLWQHSENQNKNLLFCIRI